MRACLRPAEALIRACMRPTQAARFRVQSNANTLQLIVAVIQRFVRHAYAARFRIIQTRKTLCALCTYTKTVLSVFFVHGNGDTCACLRRG